MKNKNLAWSIFLLIAAGLILIIVFKGRSPFGKGNSSFACQPKTEITKIELTEGARRLTLEKKGENWFLNGKIETRKSSILYILRVLQEIRIKSPVSAVLFESEIKGKGVVPVRVKVYEKRQLLKSFLVFKTPSNIYGNIMKIRGGSKPFIVYVPGFENDIGSGFTLNELFWQPYIVFNQLPSEIAAINFENISDTASSFSVFNNNQHYSISGLGSDLAGWDSSLVKRYLSYFTWIPFESWAFELEEDEFKKTEAQPPLYRITMNTTGGRKIVLTLWERMTIKDGILTKDTDRLFGKTETGDEFFIIRYFDIDPLLKKRSYFFPE